MTDIRNELERLVAEHGVDSLQEAAAEMQNSLQIKVPAHHLGVLNAKALQYTIDQINAMTGDILTAGEAREAAYVEIGDLRKQSRVLETEIELAESEALMNIEYDGKDAYGVLSLNNELVKRVLLSNDKSRKAYMLTASKDLRKQKSLVDGEISKIESNIRKSTAAWETANTAAASVGHKADIQSNLLRYLSR